MLDELALGLLEPLLLAAAGFAHRPHRFVVPFHAGGLPLSEGREAPADYRAVTPQEAPERTMRILLAEDSDASRFMLRRAVESLGHECVAAEDGLAAWQAFQQADPEVVISDWLMPGIDGDELCRRIRANPDAPYSYFIMLTGLEDKGNGLEGRQGGADDYLSKPLDPHDLEMRLVAAARVTGLHRRL